MFTVIFKLPPDAAEALGRPVVRYVQDYGQGGFQGWAVGREYIDRTPFRRGTETLIKRGGLELSSWLGGRDGIRNWLITAA